MTRFINIITGHNNLAYHCSKADEEMDSNCRFCNTDSETFYHWVTDCPALCDLRIDCGIGPVDNVLQNWSIDRLMAFSYNARIADAISGDQNNEDSLISLLDENDLE